MENSIFCGIIEMSLYSHQTGGSLSRSQLHSLLLLVAVRCKVKGDF